MTSPAGDFSSNWNSTLHQNISLENCLPTPGSKISLYKDVTICLGLCIAVAGKPKLVGVKLRSILLGSVCSMGKLLALPLLSLVFTLLGVYREVARSLLLATRSPGSHVVDLFHGTDAFWALEDERARSVINVLSLVDFGTDPAKCEMEPLKTVQEIIRGQLRRNPLHFWKLLCHRKLSKFGYYYWERQNKVKLEDHIKWMEIKTEECVIARGDLSKFVSSVVNKELPWDNHSCWEIYVGKRPMAGEEGRLYPLLLRIHHTVGDGVALINLLVNSLAENAHISQRSMTAIPYCRDQHANSDEEPPFKETQRTVDVYKTSGITNFETPERTKGEMKFLGGLRRSPQEKPSRSVKDVKLVLNSCTNRRKVLLFVRKLTFAGIRCAAPKDAVFSKIVIEGTRSRTSLWSQLLGDVLKKVLVLLLAPISLARQAARACDSNLLHGTSLSGNKLVAWHLEQTTDPGERLLAKIRRIRDKTGSRFSDVLFTALSESFEAHYDRRGDRPRLVTVVVPSRISHPFDRTLILSSKINVGISSTKITRIINRHQSEVLTNTFTFGLLSLPISGGKECGVFRKLKVVRDSTEELRTSADQLINYWLIDVLLTLLPVVFIRSFVRRMNCTMAVSNLPGPVTCARFGSHKMQDIVFWIPNKEKTGIGLTVLTYAGKTNLGILCDTSLIPNQEDVQQILDGILQSIDIMDKTKYLS